jgi:hypothetical protein
MTIRFSTYSTYIGHFFGAKTRMTTPDWLGVIRGGPADDGGISLLMFAEDGEASFSGPHPTWISASSVHMARPLQTFWRIHLPFHLSSITLTNITTSPQKTKREQSSLSRSVIASVASAFACPL